MTKAIDLKISQFENLTGKRIKYVLLVIGVLTNFLTGTLAKAQTNSIFQQEHTKLLDDYVLFIDSVEKKQPKGHYFEIFNHKHFSKVEFMDERFVYQIRKR